MDDKLDILSTEQQLQLQNAQTSTELEQIINLFNINLKKKELIRVSKLSTLQDKITDQVEKRLNAHSDEFSNKDLIDYFKVFQDTIQKTDKTPEGVATIQITQNQLNVNIDQPEFDRDSRERILQTVQRLIAQSQEQSKENNEGVINIDEYEED